MSVATFEAWKKKEFQFLNKRPTAQQAWLAAEKSLQDELETLRNFFALFKSYNPDLPMGDGMKAEFNFRRSMVEELEER
jgi:hypothetical protein